MKRTLLLLVLVSDLAFCQVKLSDKAEISVMTFGPSQQEVYTAFGHSAFRVNDPINGIDEAYNYGVFDFDQPNFYLNFAKGHLYYRLGVSNYRDFEYYYIYFNRFVHEQKLNLSDIQKQRVYDFLQWNALPENQYYLYDYFYNNCATKMPDIIVQLLDDTVSFDGSYIKEERTIRELTDLYLTYQPWGDLGIDLGLGLPMDKKASPYEHMFLPDYVESGFANATIARNGKTEPLVKELVVIFEPEEQDVRATLITPLLVMSIFFVIISVISFLDIRRNKTTTMVDIVLFTAAGVLGVLLLLLWLATDHRAAARNLNLLWALPTHLIAVFALIKNPRWLEKYFFVVAILSLVLLAAWPVLPQKLHYALIPLVMSLGLRAYTQYRIRKDKSSKRKDAEPQLSAPASGSQM